jgi:hypothetical protein
MFEKKSISEFVAQRNNSEMHYLGRSSFEARSVAIPNSFESLPWASFLAFHSKVKSALALKSFDILQSVSSMIGPEFPVLDISEPLEVAKTLHKTFGGFAERAKSQKAIIDITSFRREELLMLFSLMHSLGTKGTENWELVYVGAQGMGDWLSGKVTGVRSVYGYPGEMWPSKKTRLILLMGFEVERARSIFEAYEPAIVYVGSGKQSDSISDELHQRNLECLGRIMLDIGDAATKQFEFSARDPSQLVLDLEAAIEDDPTSNTIIAPLNTKLSTLGAGMYAKGHPAYQVCYASVDTYNEEEFSQPSQYVYRIPLTSLF